MRSFYVATPIYYANDKPHVGHAYTTVAADVLARYWAGRLGAEQVFFLTGTDEHGQKIAEAAARAGLEPKAYVDTQVPKFERAWQALGVQPSIFMRTTDPEHEAFAASFLQRLFDRGDVYKGAYDGVYCVGCEAYKTETELQDGRCPDHPNLTPERRTEENYFFKLTAYVPRVIEAIESGAMKVEPTMRRNEVLARLKGEVRDISISRPGLSWGVPLPWDNSHTAYVWVEALLNYLSALEKVGRTELWPANVQLMGKEILWFHAGIWPALLLAGGYALPEQVFAHGWFTVDGQKMSKTVGNVVDPIELAEEWGTDAARYFLLSAVPFGADGDIQKARFAEIYVADLANSLGNLLHRTVTLIRRAELVVEPELDVRLGRADEAIEAMRLDEGLKEIWAVVREANKAIEDARPWLLMKDPARRTELEAALVGAYRALEAIAAGLAPYLPETSAKILAQLQGGDLVPLFLRKDV
ncbi:MAG: methionine--tRNA ligase [Patescibacteria group bacterium]|jgi:methionyl-tRNA synthetase